MNVVTRRAALGGLLATPLVGCGQERAPRAPKNDLETQSFLALENLRAQQPFVNRLLAASAGVLVMPSVKNAGLFFGGTYGEGTLFQGGQRVDFYNVIGLSWGLQIGAEAVGNALFFMSDTVLADFKSRDGWTAGADISFTAIDEAESAKINNNNANADVYSVTFDQKGARFGLVVEGGKYSRIKG